MTFDSYWAKLWTYTKSKSKYLVPIQNDNNLYLLIWKEIILIETINEIKSYAILFLFPNLLYFIFYLFDNQNRDSNDVVSSYFLKNDDL